MYDHLGHVPIPYPNPMEAPHVIWFQSAQQFAVSEELSFENVDDANIATDGPLSIQCAPQEPLALVS